jgi:two-component sensor histidine kinase
MKTALKITGVYLVVSILWITLSDSILASLVTSAEVLTKVQTYKGLFFVTINSLLIFYMVRSHLKTLESRLARETELAKQQQNTVRELDHRVRNNLAELGSLMAIYRRSSTSVSDLAERIQLRVSGFKTAHELIASNGFERVPLSQVIRTSLGDNGGAQFVCKSDSDLKVTIDPLQVSPLLSALLELGSHAASCASRADGTARAEVRIEASWQDYFLPDKNEKWVRVSCTIHAGSAEQHEPFMTSRDSGSGRSLVDGLIRFNLSGESHIKVVDADLICRFEIPGESLRSMEHPNVDVRRGTSSSSSSMPSSNPSPSARPGQSISKPAQPVKT